MQRIASAVVSIYITTTIYGFAAFVKPLTLAKGSDQLFWNHLAIFAILFVPIYIVMSDVVQVPSARGIMRSLKVILLGVALAGLTISLLYHVMPLEPIFDLPSIIDRFFASDLAFTIWLIAPLVVMFF